MNDVLSQRLYLPALLFLALWGVHLCSSGGTVVPYRDTGEMVVNARTLGVAHPPGYPLYALAGKALDQLPFANPAYRLNLLSALAAAAVGLLIFFILDGGASPLPAVLSALLWSSSHLFWELSAVSEMYTLSLLVILAIVLIVKRNLRLAGKEDAMASRSWVLVLFLAGLGLGVRTDVVLIAPAILFVLWRRITPRSLIFAVVLGAVGTSVFLYLPIRSSTQPWLDWMDPETFDALMSALLRRSHGGTLDLLSKSYSAGQNFLADIRLFFSNSSSALTVLGLVLAVIGFRKLWMSFRSYAIFLLLAFVVLGPVFIYLANMPPNPHAVAVLEAHFLVPQVFLLLAAGEGMRSMFGSAVSWRRGAIVAGILLAVCFYNFQKHAPRGVKRWNLHARDYALNVLRTASPGSMVVLKEDVQLFALWARTLVDRDRQDVRILAQGLGGSAWYHRMLAQQDKPVSLRGLREDRDWAFLFENNAGRDVWVSGDATLPTGDFRTRPRGLLIRVEPSRDKSKESQLEVFNANEPLLDFYLYRGIYRQTESPDFFSSDVVSEYSRAAFRSGIHWERSASWNKSESLLLQARSFDPEFPSALFHLGYVAFQKDDLAAAEKYYSRAAGAFQKTFARAEEYRSLPDVVAGLRKEAAEVWVHRGVVAEKRGAVEPARECYLEATRLDPRSAQAYYNLAVTHWNRDWAAAKTFLEKALEIEPANPTYRHFWEQASLRVAGKAPPQ